MCLALCIGTTAALAQDTTIFLVRHAEKDPALPGTSLKQDDHVGQGRARALAERLASEDIGVVFVTTTCRTLQTALPLIERLDKTAPSSVAIYAQGGSPQGFPNDCEPELPRAVLDQISKNDVGPAASQKFVNFILRRVRGRSALVVNHSNRLVDLIEFFGAQAACDGQTFRICEEDDYDDMFVIHGFSWDDEAQRMTAGLTCETYGKESGALDNQC